MLHQMKCDSTLNVPSLQFKSAHTACSLAVVMFRMTSVNVILAVEYQWHWGHTVVIHCEQHRPFLHMSYRVLLQNSALLCVL